jgi:DNA-binding winged helix-turn-helix (wHTH) protein
MGLTAPTADLAVRLADEGVPLRAIARACELPSEDLRIQLTEAVDAGRIVNLPREDWPPGCPKDQRALQLNRLTAKDKDLVDRAAVQVFRLPPTQAKLLLLMLQRTEVSRQRVGMDGNLLSVHICGLRKRLKPFNIAVDTLWGEGYQLSAENRRKVTERLLASALRRRRNDDNRLNMRSHP